MRHLLCLLFLLLPVAAAPDDKPSEDPHRVKPGDAPAPYTVDEIRKACAEGRTDRFRVERGGEATLRIFKWEKCDEQGATVEITTSKEDGTQAQTAKKASTWKEMQAHGSFPESETKITEETIEVPGGKFDCWLYTVSKTMAGNAVTLRFYFAKTLAGPPVKLTSEVMGKVESSMTLLEHKDGTAKDEGKTGEKPADGGKPAGG